MEFITYATCPCCNSASISYKLKAKDFTVSQKEFSIWECGNCTARFTQQAPVQADIGQFYQAESYISHTDTRKGLVNSLYHTVRNITLAAKRRLVMRHTYKRTGHLLDIGAGTGAFCRYMQKKKWTVSGLEPDAGTRARAASLNKINLQPAEDLFAMDGLAYDAITMWHVLEHVHELHRYLDQIRKLLTGSGRAFIAVPNYTSYDAEKYGGYWAAYDVPRHLYHFSPKSMKSLLEQHNMAIVDYVPMWYDSFYVSMLSEQYRKGAPGYAGAITNGLLSDINAVGNPRKCSSVVYVAAPV